jgi:hypothetical protein
MLRWQKRFLHAHAEGLVVAAHSAAGKRACGYDDVAARKQIRAGVRHDHHLCRSSADRRKGRQRHPR